MSPQSQPNVHVLVVEDEELVRTNAVAALQDEGFQVVEACDGDQAMSLIEAGAAVDVLFTDVNMPGQLDGVALAVRVCERRPAVRVIVASGRPLPRRQLPCEGRFLSKPYRLAQVCDTVRELIAALP